MSVAAGSIYGRIEIDTGDSVRKVDEVGKAVDRLNGRGSEALSGLSAVEGRIKSLRDQADAFEERWKGIGKTLTGIGTAILSPIVAGAWAGWGQVGAVEQATLALRAYEKDAVAVQSVLDGLLSYAQSDLGVLFSRQELFAAAQGLKIMGAETENLVDYVEIMSRSVGLGTGNWDDLSRVIGRVGATGRLAGEDFEMLTKMGYQLDDSLRNTNMTWEELFQHLDQGMPSDALAGQADTIRGKTIRLQSALRNLGLAFLGVDAATSTFIKGGLGDSLVKALTQGRQLLIDMQPAARALGGVVATVASGISSLVDAFLRLPDPVRQFAASIVVGAGALSLLAGTTLLMIPHFLRFRANLLMVGMEIVKLAGLTPGIHTLGQALRALTLTNPLFWVLSAAVGAFLAYQNNFLGFRDAVNGLASGFWNLDVIQRVREWTDGLISSFRSFFSAFGNVGGTQTVDLQIRGDDKKLQTIMEADGSKRYMVMGVKDDGSLAEYGEIMESYLDPDNANIAHIRIVGEDGEYWTTIDKTTGEIGHGTIEVEANTEDARSRIERLQEGLTAMERTLRQRNMPMFASLVRGLNQSITGLTRFGRVWNNAFHAFRQDGNNPVAAGFKATRMALYDLSMLMGPFGGLLRGIGDYFGFLGNTVQSVTSVFQSFRSQGLSPVQAGVQTLLSYFPNLSGVVGSVSDSFSSYRDALLNVRDAMSSFFDGSWSEGFLNLREAAENGISGIVSAFDALLEVAGMVGTWVIDRLGDLGSRLWAWFSGAVQSVDWDGIWNASLETLRDAGSWVADKLGDAWTAISTWFTEQVHRVPWGALARSSLDTLASFGSWITEKMGDVKDDIGIWFNSQFGGVDWSGSIDTGIGNLSRAIRSAIGSMANVYDDLLGWLDGQITSVDWDSLGRSVGDLLGKGILAFLSLINIKQGLFDQVSLEVGGVDWPGIGSSFMTLFNNGVIASLHLLNGIVAGIYDAFAAEFKLKPWDDLWAAVWDPIDDFIDASIEKINTFLELLSRIPGVDIGPIGESDQRRSNRPVAVDSSGQGYYEDTSDPDRGIYRRPRPAVNQDSSTINVPAMEMGNLQGMIAWVKLLEQITPPAVNEVKDLNDRLLDLDRSSILASSGISATASAVPMFASAARDADTATGTMASNMGSAFNRVAASALSNFSAMQSSASREALAMSTNTTTASSGMQAALTGHMLGMRTQSALQMGLMAASARTSGSEMSTGMTGWLAGATTRIAASMLTIVANIRGVASTGHDAGYYAGSMISQGFASGMLSQLGVIRGAANQMVAAAAQAVIAKAMISSPSRLFEQYGAYIGEGLEVGILKTLPAIDKASRQLIDAGIPISLDNMALQYPYAMGSGGHYAPPPVPQVIYVDNSQYFSVTTEEMDEIKRKTNRANSYVDARMRGKPRGGYERTGA